MSEERTMLGGKNWKIIREMEELPSETSFSTIFQRKTCSHAEHVGEDLYVSSELFDAIESCIDRPNKGDLSLTEEIQNLGRMLTATTDADLGRLESAVTTLVELARRTRKKWRPGAS